MEQMKDVKEIKITYEDGTEKVVTRGCVFSVYEQGEFLKVTIDGLDEKNTDCIVILATVARIAKELGIDDSLIQKVITTKQKG